jgi:uncharacterized protein
VNSCFGDTSYYLALLIPQDSNFEAAKDLARDLRRPVITSEFVVLEVGNYLSTPPARMKFGHFLRVLLADPYTTVLPASTSRLARGIELYLSRNDKAWSVTDCISMAIMNEQHIVDALTADHHFEQAGFRILLK